MASVEFKSVRKSFGTTHVLKGIDFSVRSGEFVVLVGPSGCGKSTLLRLVAGLEDATEGGIAIDGAQVNDLSPKDRGVSMVFQNYALYPHMTVRDNMAFGLKLARVSPSEVSSRVEEASRVLGLSELLERKPGQLSGGQKQRVAMGRAMVRRPKVFLFDEPLSNLDAQLRVKMRSEISLLHRKVKATAIYVTHDQVEAMTLADRIAVMHGGLIEQVGTPSELYTNPRTRFVASFIGTPAMNFIPSRFFPPGPPSTAEVGFRPESCALGKGDGVVLSGRVVLVEPLGSQTHVHIEVEGGTVVCEAPLDRVPAMESEAAVTVNPSALFFFDGEGRRLEKEK